MVSPGSAIDTSCCALPGILEYLRPHSQGALFGLTPAAGNHGEDVKEYYFYLDNTPTHSYMRCLYKYPQAAFPYELLAAENRRRQGRGLEYELLETGVFDDDRYFDITIEYAKFDPEDIAIRIRADNRGPAAAPLHIIPQLWFRNTWSWTTPSSTRPVISMGDDWSDGLMLVADDSATEAMATLTKPYRLGPRILFADPGGVYSLPRMRRAAAIGSPLRTQFIAI